MKNLFKNIKKYPLIIFFGILLYVISIADWFSPQYEFSDLENRRLSEFPAFSLKALFNNEYTPKIEDFTEDHFIKRNSWISLKSVSETILGKGENNGIVYGKDGYLFTKSLNSDKSQMIKNADALAKFIDFHPETNIKIMIAPTAPSVLTDMVKPGSPVNNASDSINKVTELAGAENVIDVTSTLKSHSDEYIYYKTDHHWTTLGAYYAYSDFMQSIGRSPKPLDFFEFVNVDNFLGTHYSKSKNFNVQPDTLSYIKSDSKIEIMGKETDIYDLSKLETRDKYAMFLHGNNSMSTVKGTGEGKLLVIKDSFANCFIPFLTADFEQIDILDMRSYIADINLLMNEMQYDNVLVLYNSETFESDAFISRLIMYNK